MTPDDITMVIPGPPVAWARARVQTRAGKPRFFKSAETRAHAARIRQYALCCWSGPPWPGPVFLTIVAYFEIPKNWPKWRRKLAIDDHWMHAQKPDLDNIAKAVMDGLTGLVYQDDAQVAAGRTVKRWDTVPRTVITVQFFAAQPRKRKDIR